MAWFDDPFERVEQEWEAREVRAALSQQPYMEDLEPPHTAGYWTWVVIDTFASVVAGLLALALVILTTVVVIRWDEIGALAAFATVGETLALFSALLWLSVQLRGRRLLRPLLSMTGEALLVGWLLIVLVATM